MTAPAYPCTGPNWRRLSGWGKNSRFLPIVAVAKKLALRLVLGGPPRSPIRSDPFRRTARGLAEPDMHHDNDEQFVRSCRSADLRSDPAFRQLHGGRSRFGESRNERNLRPHRPERGGKEHAHDDADDPAAAILRASPRGRIRRDDRGPAGQKPDRLCAAAAFGRSRAYRL
jgi:hypothetical protein